MELNGDDEVANLFQFLVIRFSNVEVQIQLLFGVDGGEFEKSGRRLEFARRKESVVKSQTLCTPLTLFALPWSIFGVASFVGFALALSLSSVLGLVHIVVVAVKLANAAHVVSVRAIPGAVVVVQRIATLGWLGCCGSCRGRARCCRSSGCGGGGRHSCGCRCFLGGGGRVDAELLIGGHVNLPLAPGILLQEDGGVGLSLGATTRHKRLPAEAVCYRTNIAMKRLFRAAVAHFSFFQRGRFSTPFV